MTLDDLLAGLSAVPAEAYLVFQSETGEIGGRYHVTEFKVANVTSIDCAARQDRWVEAFMQLLDGPAGDPMQVDKFIRIATQSRRAMPDLGSAPLRIEFAPKNAGLRLYHLDAPVVDDRRVTVHLREDRAVCKPSQSFTRAGVEPPSCCTAPARCAC